MSKPTKKQRKFVLDFLADVRQLFELTMYNINVGYPEKQEEDVYADVTVEHDYRRVTINLYEKFWKLDRQEQVQTLLHELCHSITHQLRDYLIDAIKGEKMITEEMVRHADERATSHIEQIITMLCMCNRDRDMIQKYYNGKEEN